MRKGSIQIYLMYHWKASSRDLQVRIPVTDYLRDHLTWWDSLSNLSCRVHLQAAPPQEVIIMDASNLGFGGYLELEGHFWGPMDAGDSDSESSYKSERNGGCGMDVSVFLNRISGKTVLVKSDNASVVAYLNKEGGTRSSSMCVKTFRLFLLLAQKGINLCAVHIR